MIKEIFYLLKKELILEWKQKYAFNGLVLYVLSMVVVISLAFVDNMDPQTWNIIYWIILLFVAINAIARSFMAESSGHLMYLYSLAHPASVIIAKIIYNTLLLFFIAVIALIFFQFLGGVKINEPMSLLAITFAGGAALSANLTLVSAISSRAENKTTLQAVLGFPLVVPILLLLIRLSRPLIEGAGGTMATDGDDSLFMLAGITFALVVFSVILFPFVWRE
ncbi:MAG: heme exporter protein CcmB [Bacteroidia bacterium]|nr:heme exporter protein CcmB [Bacteroidia bacterium]